MLLYEEAYNKLKEMSGTLSQLFSPRGKLTKIKTHCNLGHLKKHLRNSKTDVCDIVSRYFKLAWDHQADGGETNATITNGGICNIATELMENSLVSSGDMIVDCGSSYGSLLLSICNKVKSMNPNIHLKGYGIEINDIRNELGSYCFLKLIDSLRNYDNMPLYTIDVRLEQRDLFSNN